MTDGDRVPPRRWGGSPAARRRRGIGCGLTLVAVVLVLAACLTYAVNNSGAPVTGGSDLMIDVCGMHGEVNVDTCGETDRMPGGDIVVALDQAPAGWNSASVRGGTDPAAVVETSLLPSAFIFQPSGKIRYNDDLLAATPAVTGYDPAQVVYRIRDGAAWNDGAGGKHPVSAQDFVFAWRSHDGHDPHLKVVSTAGYDQIFDVEAGDGDRTVTVTFRQPYGDWRGLFTRLEPYYVVAAASGADPTDANAMTDAQLEKASAALEAMPKFSAGPYIIRETGPGGAIVEVPNPRWYGRIKPTLNTITFRPVSARGGGDVVAMQNHELNLFVANASADLLAQLMNMPAVYYQFLSGFTWEHLQLNTRDPFLRDGTLRQAVLDAVNVDQVTRQTVNPYFKSIPLHSHNLFPTEPGYQDVTQQIDPLEGTGNLDAAKKLLVAAGYTGVGTSNGLRTPDGRLVTIALAHTDTPVRDRSAQLITTYLAGLGIAVTGKASRDMPTTLAHGDFGIAEIDSTGSALLGATAARLWSTNGPENFTGWGDPGSDALLVEAAQEMDASRQAVLLNQQDRILTAAHVDLPLYRRPEVLAYSPQFMGMRINGSGGYFTYNTQEWGLLRTYS